MPHDPKVHPPAAGLVPDALADLVYRPSLAEGNRAVRGARPWLTVPATLAVCAVVGGLVALTGGRAAERTVPPSVGLVLQEGTEPPGPASASAASSAPGGGRPRPGPPAPGPAAAAPPPAVPLPAPPPREAAPEAAPQAAPRELPKEDHSKDYGGTGGGGAVAAGLGAGGGTGGGSGGGQGDGVGAGGGRGSGGLPGRMRKMDITQLTIKYRPPKPDYPPLARSARLEGTVVVVITVGVDGVPVSVRAQSGPSLLRAAAVAHFQAWRFEPYRENGVPEPVEITYSMRFKLD